ncbi:conserved hypothetical protein [Ricinus communis]|uniref:WPP domain-associated protein n=2 Tax=Ricinus communis TaxID=3988 RepID=B9SUB4_RICCO|nr:conserved hypothetical protein [Ricinus communis]
MKEMKCLHDELEALCLSESNHESKNFLKPRGESPAEEDQYRKPKCYSSSVKEVDQEKQLGEKGSEDNDGNYVAKLIKNHESIIKRKNKELNWLKREISGGKGSSDAGREEDLVSSKRRIQDVIERMQNLVNWNAELGENYEDDEGDENVEGSSTKRLCNFTTTQQEGSLAEISEDGQEKVNKISISDVVSEELRKEIRMLKEEKEDASLQTMIMEQTYATIWEGCVYESSTELLRYDLEILITKGIHEDLLKKMVNEWNGQMGCYKMDAQIREEISYIVLSEAVKDFDSILDSILVECQDSRAESSCLVDYNLEGTLREDVTKVLLREICKEWNELVERSDAANLTLKKRYQIEFEETLREIRNTTNHKISKYKEVNLEGKLREEISRFLFGELYKEWYENIERSDTENLVREDIYNIAIQETFINIAHTGNSPESKLNEVNNSENGMEGFPFHNESFKLIEHSIKEDLLMVFLKEMSKEWKKETDAHNFESLIGEEIFLLALFGAIKEANTAYRETAAQDHFNISGEKFQRSQELNGEDVLINKEDSQMNCVEVQAGLIQSMSSESKEYSGQHDIIQLKHKKLDKLKISRELLTEMGSNFTCLSSKVEKALEQLTVSKEIVNELRCCLGAAGEDQKAFVDSAPNTRPSRLQQKEIKRVKLTPPYSAFTPFMEFLQIFMDFQCTVEEKLELNILRLEGAMQHLNPLAELVARRRRKERLYRKAFISRCENLRKAETEVDLLGNQVEVLLVLLEKIYTILHNCSPVLKNCSEVSDILKMIRKELDGELLGFTD